MKNIKNLPRKAVEEAIDDTGPDQSLPPNYRSDIRNENAGHIRIGDMGKGFVLPIIDGFVKKSGNTRHVISTVGRNLEIMKDFSSLCSSKWQN